MKNSGLPFPKLHFLLFVSFLTFSKTLHAHRTIEFPNSPPIVSKEIEDQSTPYGKLYSFTIPENIFSDPDGDALSYSVSLVPVGLIDNTQLPEWLLFDENELTLSGTPAKNNVGTLKIKVTASDRVESSVHDVFILEISEPNAIPQIVKPIADQSHSDELCSISMVDLSNTFTDPENDLLTLTAEVADEKIGTAAIAGNMLIMTRVGLGTTTVTVHADDGHGGSVSDDFTYEIFHINASPEVLNPIKDQHFKQNFSNAKINLAEVFEDKDHDLLTFQINILDEKIITASISENELTLQEVGIGTTSVTVLAKDGNGGESATSFDVTIETVLNTKNSLTLNLFPVPSQDQLKIHPVHHDAIVQVFAVTGKEWTVNTKKLPGKVIALDIHQLPQGNYFIHLNQGGKITRHRFMKYNNQ